MHSLCTLCIHVSYTLSMENPFTVISSVEGVLNCTKLVERMKFSHVYDVNPPHYEQQSFYVHYHLINVCFSLSAFSGHRLI